MTTHTLDWSERLALGLEPMDRTHHEFVDLLAAVQSAGDGTVLAAWDTLITHTDGHFGQEDRWMRETRFASGNCHATQHHVVLQVMREGARRGAGGDLALVRRMADELADWFPQHAQTMDAALALHLRSVAYDPATGSIGRPQALPAQEITGCGSGACGDARAEGDAGASDAEIAVAGAD